MSTLEYIDPDTLVESDIPWAGEMPDVQMAYPWSNDGAVWPYRLQFGAEDDTDRALVSEWMQVDDLGGISKLWAGVFGNKIFLATGDSAPAAAAEDSDAAAGSPVADGVNSVWLNGQPVLPYYPVPMEARDTMLKNADGRWRKLVWEPIALFDIFPENRVVDSNSTWAFRRYTLYCITEGPWVVFYTTVSPLANGLFNDGQPARWPFSYYLSRNKTGTETYLPGDKDGGFSVGWAASLTSGYRLAPLPWQFPEGGEVAESDVALGGVSEGQFYAFAPAYPCPRYLATTFDWRVNDALNAAALKPNGEYQLISKEAAREAIVGTIQKAATDSYSVDPGVFEELGRVFPDGVLEGSIWTDKPNEYKVIFSLHIDGSAAQWPHWLAFMAALSPTGLLTASACRHYNDYSPSLPGGGGGIGGDDDENTPPDEDDPGGFTPDNTDPEEDEETDTDKNTDPIELETGFYYEAGTGVQILRVWEGKGWKHTVHIDNVSGSGSINYVVSLRVTTKNASTTYDWPEGNRYGLSMFYGVTANGSTISVSWQSSHLGGDRQPKTATAEAGVATSFNFTAEFDDFVVTSDTPPSFGGNVIRAIRVGSFVKRGTYKSWDTFAQKWTTVRYERLFEKYELTAQLGNIKNACEMMVTNSAPGTKGTVSPVMIQGKSDDIDGPDVTAESAEATPNQKATGTGIIGNMRPTITAEYSVGNADFSVGGSAKWNVGKKSGSINGTFTTTFTPITTVI